MIIYTGLSIAYDLILVSCYTSVIKSWLWTESAIRHFVDIAIKIDSEKFDVSSRLSQSNFAGTRTTVLNYNLTRIYEANITGNHNSPDFRKPKFKVSISQERKKITGNKDQAIDLKISVGSSPY